MKIVQDERASLRVQEKHTTILIIVGTLFLAALGYTLYLAKHFGAAWPSYLHWIFITGIIAAVFKSFSTQVVYLFDRRQKKIFWGKKRLLGAMQQGEYEFGEIDDVRIGYSGSKAVRKYRIEFVVGGNLTPMSEVYTQGPRALDENMETARRIKEVLGLPLESVE